jgi:hypothetical protein
MNSCQSQNSNKSNLSALSCLHHPRQSCPPYSTWKPKKWEGFSQLKFFILVMESMYDLSFNLGEKYTIKQCLLLGTRDGICKFIEFTGSVFLCIYLY